MSDTVKVFTRRGWGAIACVLALSGCAAPMARLPRVVWVAGDRAYVALRDSTTLEVGDRLSFQRGGRTIASGTVQRVDRGEMAQVAFGSGSLGAEKELGGISIAPDRMVPAPPLLRVGLPSAARRTPLFDCPRAGILAQWPENAYRADSISARVARFVRTSVPVDKPWPDTLRIRFYDESADEEIAIQRGDLDVAVFWPGELSAHMRASPRWRDPLMGIRSDGEVALEGMGAGFSPPPADALESWRALVFAPLNRDLFHGDLFLGVEEPVAGADSSWKSWRLIVDNSAPGRAELQRYLDRLMRAPPGAPALARLMYRDRYRPDPKAISSGPAGAWSIGLGRIGCPVVCVPALRRQVDALGPGTLADLIDCLP